MIDIIVSIVICFFAVSMCIMGVFLTLILVAEWSEDRIDRRASKRAVVMYHYNEKDKNNEKRKI